MRKDENKMHIKFHLDKMKGIWFNIKKILQVFPLDHLVSSRPKHKLVQLESSFPDDEKKD